MTIQPNATVNISNDDASNLVMSTANDSTYGFLVPNTACRTTESCPC